MKIISNKTWKEYLAVQKLNEKYEKKIEELNKKYLNAVSDYELEKFNVEELKKQIEDMMGALQEKQSKITDLEMKLGLCQANLKANENIIKSLKGAKGGFTKQINKLTRELEETKKKLEESMTDKYLVKKIPMGKLPKTQTMKLKSHAKQDKIIQKVYERLERKDI